MYQYPRTPQFYWEICFDFMMEVFEILVIIFALIIIIKILNCNYDPKNTDLSQLDFICNSIEWFGKNEYDTHGWFTPMNI